MSFARRPRWAELLGLELLFDLCYDASLVAMYALSVSAEGDCYLCVPPDPGIAAAALGASESALPSTAPAEALHTFTLDSGASRCIFRDSTTLTPLSAPVPIRLADPSGGPVLGRSSTALSCPAVPSGSLSGLHLPSFSTDLVSTGALQDAMVTTTNLGGVRVRSGSTPLLVSPPFAPDSPVAPLPWSPLPATPPWHALSLPCFWSSQVSATPPALTCPALPSFRRGAAARRSSLLLVSPDECSSSFLPFDHEGRPVQFDMWLDDLQLYLLSNSKDSVSLFDLASGAATAPPTTADSATRSQWLTREAATRLAIRNHLPLAKCAHFGQHRIVLALYDAVDTRYSSPATAAIGRLLLPYLFPDLSAFATVEDLVSHLRNSDARYRATVPAEFLDKNQPPMFITLYFIVTRLPDALRSVMDHFLSLDPTSLTVDLLEQHLLAAKTSAVAVGVARGTPRPPFFEGCSPSLSPHSVPDPESNRAHAASPAVARLLAIAVSDPSFESAAASALVSELLDFAATCRLDYTTALVAESESASPPSVEGECAPCTDVLEDRQEDFECLAAAVPRFASMLLAPEGDPDAPDIPTPHSYAESTCTYVDEVPPPGANIVDGMWIFRVKRPPGSPLAFKARYVARGFRQRQGVDYFQTFSPTPKMTTLWVLLHVAAQRDYELHSLDFSTAFLQGSLHEDIWRRRPPGFTGSFPHGTQWSLCRPVYGLRQAPREWHDTLRTTLSALGFAPSIADPSLFLRTNTLLPPFYVLVYVDDLVFATADIEAQTLVKLELQKRHTCIDVGELRSYLGLQITQDRARRTITLTQSHMVHQVLQRFGFQFSLPQPTPLSTGLLLSAPPSDESVEPSGPYPELVGCLMYLMTCTRPDLAYPLSLLVRYVAPSRHRKVHWDAAKRVLRYLCSTSSMGLVLGGWGPVVLTGHADASWVDDSATQRSSQGYTFSLGSGTVSWRSTRSSSVLSSSCESEIYARAMAAQKLRWLTYLLSDLGEQPRSPPNLYVDSTAMIALCQEHRLEHRTKRIALRYFLARELQQRGQICLAYVATRANTADIFTKALPPGDHQRFSTVLGLVPTLPHLLTT
ncbi:unnamed protein product [Closterium sp. NIES-54]